MLLRSIQTALLIASLLICTGICADEADSIRIRISNQTGYDLTRLNAHFPHQKKPDEHDFGNLKKDAVSDYYAPERAYRYAYIQAFAGDRKLVCQPTDFVGESYLEKGFYTYILTTDARSPSTLYIECRKDK